MFIVYLSGRFYSFSQHLSKSISLRLLLGVSLLLLLGLAIPLIWNQFTTPSRYWPGWYLVSFPGDTDIVRVTEVLESAGISRVLSESSAMVSYQKIPSMAKIPVAEIDAKIPPGDPRRDPFLSRVGRLFRWENESLVYLSAERSLSDYRKIFQSYPIFSAAKFLDDDFDQRCLWALVFLICAGSIWYLTSFGDYRIAFIALPWFLLVLMAGSELLCLGLAFYLVFSLRPKRDSRRASLVLNWVVMAVLFVFAIFHFVWIATILIVTALATCEFVLLVFPHEMPKTDGYSSSKKVLHSKGKDHTLFEPLTIALSNRKLGPRSRLSIISIKAILLVLPLFLISLFQPLVMLNDALPTVGPVVDSFSSISGLHSLSQSKTLDSLPDLSDLIASVAYQEGFLEGRHFSLPLPGDTLRIRNYKESGNRIVVDDSILVSYDAEWFRSTVDRELGWGLGRLYKSIGGIASVQVTNQSKSIAVNNSFQLGENILIFLMLFFAALLHFIPSWGDVVPGPLHVLLSTVRRRLQAA